jgi:membrane fusion protein, heavy metal efflux system
VPEAAIVYEGADAHVWVADPAHKALALREIQIDRVTHGQAVISVGLALGDNVVTSGAVFIDRTLSGT